MEACVAEGVNRPFRPVGDLGRPIQQGAVEIDQDRLEAFTEPFQSGYHHQPLAYQGGTASAQEDPPQEAARTEFMRRVPAICWILLPLAISLLYAAAHSVVAAKPTIGNVAPEGAILVHRVRGLDTLDLTSPGPRGPKVRPPREALGLERNNPGLVGVDHEDWVHVVLMPRTLGLDSTMAIFRAKDADAFEKEFMRTDFLERGIIRHAQHLHRRGDWIAVGPNRDATRRIGTGSLACEDLGEDWSMAAHMPSLVDHALQLAKHYPWRDLLLALGLDVKAARMTIDPKTKEISAFLPGDKRILRLRDSWDTMRVWAWQHEGRMRADLRPLAGSKVAEALKAVPAWTADRKADEPPPAPPSAQAWLWMPWAEHRAFVAQALVQCGVRLLDRDLEASRKDPVGAFATYRAKHRGGTLVWAERAAGTGYAMTLGVAARDGSHDFFTSGLPVDPAAPWTTAPLAEGAAPITTGDTTVPRKAPAGTIEQRQASGRGIITLGPSAEAAAEGMVAFLATGPAPVVAPPDMPKGMHLVASFFLQHRRAERILGRALKPGGFLAMLAGGDIRGALYTDGKVLRLVAHVAR